MMKTTKTVKRPAKVAKPQVQPVKKQTVSSQGKVSTPSKEVMYKVPSMTATKTSTRQPRTTSSLLEMSHSVTSPSRVFVLPRRSLTPVRASYLLSPDKLTYTKQPVDSFKQSSTKFTPYEKLTGISSERPEIVAVTQFQPIYRTADQSIVIDLNNDDRFLTPAGRFFEAQAQVRFMRAQNVFKMLKTVKKQTDLTTQVGAFKDAINDLTTSVNQMLSIVMKLEGMKQRLDLRHDIHVVTPDNMKSLNIDNYVGRSDLHANVRQETISQKFDINDVLTRFGFEKTNLLQYYASTKIWLQLLYEFKQACRSHSLLLIDADTSSYKNDKSPVFLVKPTAGRFVINPAIEMFDVETIGKIQPEQVNVVINTIDTTYKSLYNSTKFKTSDIKVAMLAWILSKEYRFSNALEQTAVNNTLTSYYRYNVSTTNAGNQQMLDAVIGQFGNDIADISAGNGNSLVDLSQAKPDANTAVLTFEEKYLVGDNGTTTPGGVYYVDSALSVNDGALTTNRLNDLATRLEGAYKNWLVMANGMNLMMKFDTLKSSPFHGPLSNPRDLYVEIATKVVDFTSGKLQKQAASDKLAAVFSSAASASGNRLKAALFALIMCRLTRTYSDRLAARAAQITAAVSSALSGGGSSDDDTGDNTPTTDRIIEDVLKALEASIQTSVTSVSLYRGSLSSYGSPRSTRVDIDQSVSEESLRTALKSGSYLLNAAETIMQKIMSTFDGDALLSDRTRFGGYQDTVILMVAFDLIVNIFGAYTGQKFVGRHTDYNSTTFLIDKTDPQFTRSINDIEGRLNVEIQLSQQCSYAITNTLKGLSDAARASVTYLESPATIAAIGAVSKTLNDEALVNVLMNRQQLLMLISIVSNMNLNLQYASQELKFRPSDAFAFDSDTDGNFDYEDEIKILDDGAISPKIKMAIEGLFKSPDFATSRAVNKKIVTVGIPVGFTEKLKQRVTVANASRTAFTDKQEDIINVCVYKVDLENPDIVYKPLKFPFEMSRFPVRVDEMQPAFKDSIDEYVNRFPTNDYTQVFESSVGNANPIQFLVPSKSETGAFADDSYSFLTSDVKRNIIQNHTVSFLLETYVHLMTGLSVYEHSFEMIESEKFVDETFAETITALQLAETNKRAKERAAAEKTKTTTSQTKAGTFFSAPQPPPKPKAESYTVSAAPAKNQGVQASMGTKKPSDVNYVTVASDPVKGTKSANTGVHVAMDPVKTPAPQKKPAPQKTPTVAAEVQKVTDRTLPIVLQQFKTVDEFTRMVTPLADGLKVSRKLLSPKQFDRVFSVIIDPDDFEIDYEETSETPQGRDALNQLISLGDVLPITENDIALQRRSTTSITTVANRSTKDNAYKYRDRDKTIGDAVFEKYFVVIETQGSETI